MLKPIILIVSLIVVLGGCAQRHYSYSVAPEEGSLYRSYKVDRVVLEKSKRQLTLVRGGETIRSYPVALGPNPRGHKVMEGDGRTPEGLYSLDWRNPNSRFYRSIHVSYPSLADREFAAQLGVAPGGMIMIHGEPNYLSFGPGSRPDWTEGCIAVSNDAMDEIWAMVDDGTPIEIKP